MALDHIKEGELALYVTKKALAKSKKHLGLPTPVVGVCHGSYHSTTRSGRRIQEYSFSPTSLALVPRIEIVEGIAHPCARPVKFCGTSVAMHCVSEMHLGKDAVLGYLETRQDLSSHIDWISKLEKPYFMPKPTSIRPNLSFI